MTTSLVTFCHPPRYVERLHRPGALREIVESHAYPFSDVVVVHNKCRAADYQAIDYPCRTVDLPREELGPLLVRWGVNPVNQRCEEITHGEGASHWWVAHNTNHFRGAEVTDSDYIVFADCDTKMVSQPADRSWIDEGIYLLDAYPHILIVGPGDGGESGGAMGEGGWLPNHARLTRNVSQQLFLCRGKQFRHEIDFDVEWNGIMNAPGGPFQEFYCLLEGRLWRYMNKTSTWRAILPDRWRYYHNSYWGTDREPEGWGEYR